MCRICNLLIADEDFGEGIQIESLLATLGRPHQCHQVPNGFFALRFLQKQPPYEHAPRPDVILLDLHLSGQTGVEVLHRIKSDPDFRSIPVIIVSKSPNRGDINACYSQHANAFIRKADDLIGAAQVLSAIEQFWLQTAELPSVVETAEVG